MAWKQLKDANWKIPYVGSWCEGYVEGAWGQATKPTANNQTTSGVYGTATAAWSAQPNKHYDLPPKGKTVPVYFSLGSTTQGHVAISLDDGQVASSTQSGFHTQGYIHPNLNDLITVYGKYNKGCKYLGWGEYVGKIRVIAPDVVYATQTQIKALYLQRRERTADAGGLKHYASYTYDFVKNDLYASAERKKLETKKAAALLAKQKADALKAKQEVEAKALADAKAADELAKQKVEQDALAKEAQVSDHNFIQVLRELWNVIWAFITLKGKQ
jgi:hypothetical protein